LNNEEENMALNESVEVENDTVDTPSTEQEATGDSNEVEAESINETDTEDTETEEGDKKGYSNRVRELNARAKKAEQEAKSLATKLAEMSSTGNQPEYDFSRVDEGPIVQPGEEIDAAELDRRLRERESRMIQRTDALVQLRGKQQEAISRINKEANDVMSLYPELNPESKSFNKDLSDAISEATESFVMRNPYSASVSSFVGKMMRPYKGAVSKSVGSMTESVVKQVSEAALRPNTVRKEEKPAGEKSIAELEAQLGVVQA
jgi:hypothetical protein